jgi:hydroxymethylpyrimidine/phosphomethylpyrimidine kinase
VSVYRDQHDPTRPGLLICAGLDPSGGAGLIADVSVARTLDTRPVGVVTALTVQNTTGVVSSQALAPATIRDQLEFLLQDVEVRAVKIGMVGSSEIATSLGAGLALTQAPVVWDPVLYPSRGDVPLVDSMFARALAAITPHLTLLTPNARELAYLVHEPIGALSDAVAAGLTLSARLDCAVLVKGGHLGTDESVDVLCRRGQVEALRGARMMRGEDVHGTGCALATAIAAHLAHGADVVEACRSAKSFVADRIASPARPGRGAPAVV